MDEFCVYVGNLDLRVSVADLEELVYELFVQVGPVEKVTLPSNGNLGWHKCFGFVEFEHKESVAYSIQLLNGISLFGRPLRVRTAGKTDAPYIAKAKGAGDPSLVAERMEDSTDCTPSLDEALHPTSGQRLSSSPPPLTTPNERFANGVPHPTLGQRLSPPNELLLSDEALHATLGQRLSPPPPLVNGSDEALHPTLGQRLSPPPPLVNGSDEALHPTLGQRLSPPPPLARMTPNGLRSSDEAPHPTLGHRLSPRPQIPITDTIGGQRLSPPPLFGCSSSWEQVPSYNTSNEFYHHSSSPWEPPSPPNPIANHVFQMPQPTTRVHNHLSSQEDEEPPPTPPPQVDPLLFTSHHLLQQELGPGRGAGDDMPIWDSVVHTEDEKNTKEAREKVRDYHLLQLGETLARYKDLFSKKSQQSI